jgi:two-component system copper resistance phosphate regulon response regulator CusR
MKIGAVKILIVEDEKKTGAYLRKGLSEAGFVTDLADNGEDGLHAATSGHYELIILDIMLPRLDGWSIISRLRENGNQIPVLILTARDRVQDRVKGLELGADDYLVKPFAFSELNSSSRPEPADGHAADRGS